VIRHWPGLPADVRELWAGTASGGSQNGTPIKKLIMILLRQTWVIFCVLALGWAGNALASGPAYVFTDLGTAGGTGSEALAINSSGQVVGGSNVTSGNLHAALFSSGQVTDLGVLAGGNQSEATAINSSGQIVGWSNNGSVDGSGNPILHAILWSGGNMTDLGLLQGDTDAQALGINDSGNIVGESYNGNLDNQAFLFTAGTGMTNLGPLASVNMASAVAINDSGQVAGWSANGSYDTSNNTILHAVLYSGHGITDLGVLPGEVYSQATGLNATGTVVGYSYNSGGVALAFEWTLADGMQYLGALTNGSLSIATGINSSGQIAGWGDIGETDTFNNTIYHAFLYSNSTLYDLNNLAVNAGGWQIQYATGINDSGQITGLAVNLAGQTHAYLLTPAEASAPGITTQPASQSVTAVNGTATFTVAALGEAPLSYQWQFNGADIPNAAGTTLVVSGVNATAAGNYTVVVSNPLGNTTSAPARLNFLVYAIVDLGTLGGVGSEGLGLNASGQVVGISATKLGAYHPFLYSGGVMTDLGVLTGGSSGEASSINDAGQITGWGDTGKGDVFGNAVYHAFLYSGGTMTDIGVLSSDQNTNAYSINDSGSIVGLSFTNTLSGNTSNPFLYTAPGNISLLPHLNGVFGQANDINNEGEATGWGFTGNTDASPQQYGIYHAVYYSPQGEILDLGTLAGEESSIGLGINAQGVVVGYSYNPTSPINLACVWPLTGPAIGLGVLPGGSTSEALSINSYDQIVGSGDVGVDQSDNSVYHAFLYSDGAMYDLSNLTVNASGWGSTFATGINDAGQIVGYGNSPSGQTHAFLLTAVTPPAVVTPPGNQTVTAGGTATFSVNATGLPAPTVQWQFSNDGGKTWNNVTGGNYSGATSATLTASNTTTGMSGYEFRAVSTNYSGSVPSGAAVLVVNAGPPIITGQPASLEVLTGASAMFTVTAEGAGNLSYQWQFKGKNISKATASSYTIAKAAAANVGVYDVIVTNLLGNVTSLNAALTLGALPKITTQPAKLTVKAGQSATFKAPATGTPAPAFQWQVSTNAGGSWSNLTSGGNVSGATSANLTLGNTTGTMSGDQYRAVASNLFGSSTSKAAVLTVNAPPVITTQPEDDAVAAGASASFSVAASGAALKYQWWFAPGVSTTFKTVAGATKATLTLSKVTAAKNAGSYKLIVTNAGGSATSNTVTLTVN
jgi:probable HAF family extracellular repeat protein